MTATGLEPKIITLSMAELASAAMIGMQRHLMALKRGMKDRHGHEGAGWSLHIEGACGEMAAAKAIGVYWVPTVGTFKRGGDVGDIQVRTRSRHDYDLIVRDDDDPAHTFVLVTGTAPNFWVRGYIEGRDARRDEWRQAHGGREPAWFVPVTALNSVDRLRHSNL